MICSKPAVYEIAGLRIVSAVKLDELQPMLGRFLHDYQPTQILPDRFVDRVLFEGVGHVLGAERRVSARCGPFGYRIEVESAPGIDIAIDGSRIDWAPGLSPDQDLAAARVALLGPSLLVAMAELGRFSFHASCAVFGAAAVLFVGPSGAGKSTLAAELSRHAGWTRLTDDVSPILGATHVSPRYPQLKLDRSAAASAIAGGSARLACIYGLDSALDVSVAPMSAGAAHRLLVAQTVAARLFAPRLLARHHQYVGGLVKQVPVRALRYPRRLGALDEVRELLERDISGPA